MMANTIQLQKAYGNLPTVTLDDCKRADLNIDTSELPDANNRLCGHPDAYDSEIADSDEYDLARALDLDVDECRGLVFAHQRMAGQAVAPGWGKCYGEHYSVKYFIDLDTYPAHYKRPVVLEELQRIDEAKTFRDRWSLEELQDRFLNEPMIEVCCEIVDESYRVLGVQHIRVNDGPSGTEHNVHMSAKRLGGSTIGLAYYPSGQCNDHVHHYEDTNYRPDLIACCKLVAHEWGHNHGEGHQFRGQATHKSVMSYSPPRLFYGFSTGEGEHVLPRDKSIDSLINKYGGVPVPVHGDEPPDTGDGEAITIKLQKAYDRKGKLILTNRINVDGETFTFSRVNSL